MPDVTFFCDLPAEEIQATQDAFIIKELKDYKIELDEEYSKISKCLQRYPAVFTPATLERRNFMSIYAQVCSRCFGWDLPHTSMIPMADNFNHSDVNVTFEFVTKSLHL